ncbi:hypothetical protein [Cellulophaga baltica]|uniref:Uncharacterized protein n=1 Tax=Cellulophaga baltica 18 TaxID=1348584 RepID=A0AAU8RBA8_9FLAO|nr:hypothetical protein [Cellulophaga baltica]AIZ41051.1 hypothetical protein M666_05435 [Cellulophaga baltica 18]
MNKLTEEQIQELYSFTRDHFVYHFDLQTELVDHLANGIEVLLLQHPNLSFNEALQMEFKKFGVFGFQEVVEERRKALNKKYLKIIFNFYKAYFTIPKIMLTVILTILLYTTLSSFTPNYQNSIIMGLYLSFFAIAFIRLIKYNTILKKKKHKWMLEEILLTQMGLFSLFQLPIHILNMPVEIESSYFLGLMSFFNVSIIILFYVMVFQIPSKAEDLLEKTYPEYKLTKTL